MQYNYNLLSYMFILLQWIKTDYYKKFKVNGIIISIYRTVLWNPKHFMDIQIYKKLL